MHLRFDSPFAIFASLSRLLATLLALNLLQLFTVRRRSAGAA